MSLEAVKAGCCASLASLFGKLSGVQGFSTSIGLFLKVAFFLLMVLCNAGVWTCYAKALQHSKSSVPATVTSTATSYLGSVCTFKYTTPLWWETFKKAILGKLVFGETVSLYWWSGATLILLGLSLIVSDQRTPTKEH